MGGWRTSGVSGYIGMTRTGKTTLATRHALADTRRTGQPLLVVDCEEAQNFIGHPHAGDVEEVAESLFIARRPSPVWTPASAAEWDRFCRMLAVYGGVHILLDGAQEVGSWSKMRDPMRQALRRHGHGRLGPTTWHCVTHAPADLHRDFYRAMTHYLYVFRTSPGNDADRLRREYGLDVERITTLGRGDHEKVACGFEQ